MYQWTESKSQELKHLYETVGYSFHELYKHFRKAVPTMRKELTRLGVQIRGVGMQSARARAKYSGELHPDWKGGRMIASSGYVFVISREHPHRDKCNYMQEHRLVVEEHLRKTQPDHQCLEKGYMRKDWVVHHKNGNKQDNRIENLEPLPRSKHHSWMHYRDEMKALKQEVEKLRLLVSTSAYSN